MNEILELIKLFEKFIRDIDAAIEELKGIKSEANRSHLQKLLYVDLVNRFDGLVDSLLVEFSATEGVLNTTVLEGMQDLPIYRSEVYKMILAEHPRELVTQKIKEQTRLTYLNKRHSEKVITLLKQCFDWSSKDLESPRVDTNGRIYLNMRRKGVDYPLQVSGFADWLYSRRNVLVHSSKNQLFPRDIQYIKARFNVDVPSLLSFRLSSIKTAATFYTDLCKLMKTTISSQLQDQNA